MNEPEVFFHVGLAKTGTTYLQHTFFPILKDIKYIQRTKYRDFKYAKIIRTTDYDRYLISNEFDRQFYREISNIASVFPDAKIIIVLRRHDKWIASQYRRRIKNGYAFSFKEFLDLDKDKGFWKQKDMYFYPMLQAIEETFASRPLILFHQQLQDDPYAFMDTFAAFVGASYDRDAVNLAPKHQAFNDRQLKFIRKRSRSLFSQDFEYSDKYWVSKFQRLFRMIPRYFILYSSALMPDRFVDDKPLIPPEELARVREFFQEDWEKCVAYTEAVRDFSSLRPE